MLVAVWFADCVCSYCHISRSGKIVMCVLRGPWLDVVEKITKDANLNDVAPFIHLHYVVCSGSLESGVYFITYRVVLY